MFLIFAVINSNIIFLFAKLNTCNEKKDLEAYSIKLNNLNVDGGQDISARVLEEFTIMFFD